MTTSRSGFSLIEILIAIAIFSIIAGVVGILGNSLYAGYIVFSEKITVVAALEKARSQAMANVGTTSHGVYFGGEDYILFEGTSYAARASAYDEIIPRAPGIATTGLAEVVFNPLSGDTATIGTVNISAGQNPTTISINQEGRISY